MHYISKPLAYLKYFNQYAMITNLSTYVECKTIVDVHICNGQLKICGLLIFNWMLLHLVTVTKWSTIWRPTYFQLSIAYADINYCFANFTYVERFVIIAYWLKYFKYAEGLLMYMLTCYIHHGLPWQVSNWQYSWCSDLTCAILHSPPSQAVLKLQTNNLSQCQQEHPATRP